MYLKYGLQLLSILQTGENKMNRELSTSPPELKIYCARPITGCTYSEVVEYYRSISKRLSNAHYRVLLPMVAKGYLEGGDVLKGCGYSIPACTDRAIKKRDRWMVGTCDVLFANLIGSNRVSIGTTMELAWGDELRKHVVVATEPGNVHQHAFITECADIILEDEESALQYLETLGLGNL